MAPTSSKPGPAFADVAFTNGYEFTQGSGYQLPEYPFVEPPDIRSREVRRHGVEIVGGGISGLTLACSLAQLGVKAVLLDEDNTVGVKGASSRGICYTQKSLEIFDKLGIYQRIARKGIQWSVGRTFAGKDEVYSFDLRQQSNFQFSNQPPFINIQQFYIEGFLVERIAELNRTVSEPIVDMRWQSRVVGFEQKDGFDAGPPQGKTAPSGGSEARGSSFAALTVETPAGRYQMQADHVIDASGSHTPFHVWCGATLKAKKGDDRWCIADVRFSKHPPIERHTWIEAPSTWSSTTAATAKRRCANDCAASLVMICSARSSGWGRTPTAASAQTSCASAASFSWATPPKLSVPLAHAAATLALAMPTTWRGNWPRSFAAPQRLPCWTATTMNAMRRLHKMCW